MKKKSIWKLWLFTAMAAVLISGCVISTSSVTVNYSSDKPDSSEHLYLRYSDGTVAAVPDAAGGNSVTVATYTNKTIVGGYASDGSVSWVPIYSYPNGSTVDVSSIQASKPAYAADHVELTKQPEQDLDHSGYIKVTFAVYDADDQLVTGRTEVFAHSANSATVFYNTDPAEYSGFKTVEAAEGFSSYTANGYVTFLIKSGTADIVSPISLYSGAQLIAENVFHEVTGITVSSAGGVSSLYTGESVTMSAEVLPLNAAHPSVTWSVVNGTGSATIDAVSGVLTAASPGTITVEAEATDGSGITGSFQLTILEAPTQTPTPTPTPTPAATEKPDPEPVLVAGITVTGASSVQAGSSIQMTAVVLPAEAAEQAVIWSVEQGTGTAVIDVHGTLTGVSAGVVTVKATAVDGSAVHGSKDVEIIAISGGGGSLPAPTPVPTADPTPSATASPTPSATAAPAPVATPALTSNTTPAPTPSTTPAPTATPVPVPVQPGVQFVDKIVDIASVLTSLSHKIEVAQTNPAPLKFTDTSAHWADSTVGIFVKLGVVTGYQDGGFHPDASITRAEFATVLAKVFDLSGNAAGSPLTDISGHWAEDSIRALQQKGVISGYQNGTFLPNREISRAEIIAMISKIINLNSVNAAASSGFSDLDKTWNKEQIAQAAAAGIISGEGGGLFLPAKQASRAEALTIVLHVLETNPELKGLLDTLK